MSACVIDKASPKKNNNSQTVVRIAPKCILNRRPMDGQIVLCLLYLSTFVTVSTGNVRCISNRMCFPSGFIECAFRPKCQCIQSSHHAVTLARFCQGINDEWYMKGREAGVGAEGRAWRSTYFKTWTIKSVLDWRHLLCANCNSRAHAYSSEHSECYIHRAAATAAV